MKNQKLKAYLIERIRAERNAEAWRVCLGIVHNLDLSNDKIKRRARRAILLDELLLHLIFHGGF